MGTSRNPANINLFKVNNTNTRKRCKVCSKLTKKTLEPSFYEDFSCPLPLAQPALYLFSFSMFPFDPLENMRKPLVF